MRSTLGSIVSDKIPEYSIIIQRLYDRGGKKKKKKTIVFPIYENWSEIGSFQDYDPVKKIKRKN